MIKRINEFLPDVKNYYSIDEAGNVYSDYLKGRTLKRRYVRGYVRVALSLQNGSQQDFFVHRLVLMAFCPNKDCNILQVNHIDGNKDNNNLNNLEWCSASQNQQHAVLHGLSRLCHQYGEDNAQCKLSDADIQEIFKWREQGLTHAAIAEKFHVSRRHIGNILQGKRRNHKQV